MSWSGNNNNRKRNREKRRPAINNNNWGRRRSKNSEWGRPGWDDYPEMNSPNWGKPKNWGNNWNQHGDHVNQNFEENPKKGYSKNEEPSSNLKRRFHRKQVEEYDQGYYDDNDGGSWNDNWNNMGDNWGGRGNNWNSRGNNRKNNRNQWNNRGNNWDDGGNNNWNGRGNNWDKNGWEGDDQMPYDDYEQGFNNGRNKRRKVSENFDNHKYDDFKTEDFTEQNDFTTNRQNYNEKKKDFDDGFMQVYDSTMGRGLQFADVQPTEIEETEEKKETRPENEPVEGRDPSLFGVSLEQSREVYVKYRDVERALYAKHKHIAVPRDVQRNARNIVGHVEQLLKKVAEIIAADPASEKEESLYMKEKLKAEKLEQERLKRLEEKAKEAEENGEEAKENGDGKENAEIEPPPPPTPNDNLLYANEIATEIEKQPDEKADNGETETKAEEEKKPEVEKVNPVQVLLGVIRCGQFECRLMLAGRYHSELVVVCKDMPTKSLLCRIHRLLILISTYDKQLKTKRIIPHLHEEDEVIIIKKRDENECGFKITIRFTSPECSDPDLKPTDDDLTLSKCLQAARSIRHVRWFMAKAKDIVQLMVMRILIDLTVYQKEWSCLNLNIIQVLVHHAQLGSSFLPDQPENGGSEMHLQKANGVFKRCLEVLSSGILLPGGCGLSDPCTKNGDLSDQLTLAEAEQVTMSAQRDLRLIACGKIRRVLSLPNNK